QAVVESAVARGDWARMPVGPVEPPPEVARHSVADSEAPPPAEAKPAEAVVRVTAESLSRLMSLAREALVRPRGPRPSATALLKLKKQQAPLPSLLEAAPHAGPGERRLLEEARKQMAACRTLLAQDVSAFEAHAAQAEDLNSRLYREVIASRM